MKKGFLLCIMVLLTLPSVTRAHNMEPALESANREIQALRKELYDLRRDVEAMKKMLSLQSGKPPATTATPPAPRPPVNPKQKPRPRVVRKPDAKQHASEVDLPALLSTLNRLTAQYRHTPDPREKVQRLNEVSADAREALNGKQILLTCIIRDARPRGKGVAEIWIEPPLEVLTTHLDKRYINVTPHKWIRVKMSEAQAMNLRTGETLQLYGKALFFPQRKGDVGLSSNTQQVFTIHILNSANAIGTVTMQEYQATIGLLTFPGL